MTTVRVTHRFETWHVTVEDDDGYDDKTEAVTAARVLARLLHAELVIHNKNGRIAKRDSHGPDPEHRPG